MNYQIINAGGRLFKVVRVLRDERDWDLETLRILWHCSNTFKKEGTIYFVREIEDVLEYEEFS